MANHTKHGLHGQGQSRRSSTTCYQLPCGAFKRLRAEEKYMIPKNRIPTHPGEVLQEEFLEPWLFRIHCREDIAFRRRAIQKRIVVKARPECGSGRCQR